MKSTTKVVAAGIAGLILTHLYLVLKGGAAIIPLILCLAIFHSTISFVGWLYALRTRQSNLGLAQEWRSRKETRLIVGLAIIMFTPLLLPATPMLVWWSFTSATIEFVTALCVYYAPEYGEYVMLRNH
jgi:hypothetical protein